MTGYFLPKKKFTFFSDFFRLVLTMKSQDMTYAQYNVKLLFTWSLVGDYAGLLLMVVFIDLVEET